MNPLARKSIDQRGFTMLEVLIAILVVSFGLLGLAGLQVIALSNTHSAALRTIATHQAYDMADRMRANMAGVLAGAYNNPTESENKNCLKTAGCSFQQMAQMDAYLWNQANDRLLPRGIGVVCIDGTPTDGNDPAAPACDNAAGAAYVIKVWWDDKERDPNSGNVIWTKFVTSFQP
jgi:type IV pilus assembly protein PilV